MPNYPGKSPKENLIVDLSYVLTLTNNCGEQRVCIFHQYIVSRLRKWFQITKR
jgi:hypothetical protein